MADPPWDVHQKGGYGAGHHYKLMSLDRIKAMPVADLAAKNAHLWLWVTNATFVTATTLWKPGASRPGRPFL